MKMALLLKKIYEGYRIVNEDFSDPRTATWPLISNPFSGLAILGFYLYFVLKLGPSWMRHRTPFNLDKIVMLYNLVQIIACLFVVKGAIQLAWNGTYKLVCEPVDFSESENAKTIASYVYYYFLLKLADLFDTVVFVLRKKFNQISFLHVYHHTGMVMLTWGAVKFLPGGHGTFLGLINCIVHAIMYSYYFLTIAKPEYKKSIWWKKHITQLQILQFLLLVLQFTAMVVTPDCAYPRWTAAVFLPQNLFMLILFIDFYRRTYMKKPTAKEVSRKIIPNGTFEHTNGTFEHTNGRFEHTNGTFEHTNGTTIVNKIIESSEYELIHREMNVVNGIIAGNPISGESTKVDKLSKDFPYLVNGLNKMNGDNMSINNVSSINGAIPDVELNGFHQYKTNMKMKEN